MSERYAPWDREEKLGPPPWHPGDPKLIAWEKAHGHDVRLKCYPEFGCLLLHDEDDYRLLADAAREVVKLWDRGLYLPSDTTYPAMDDLRAALEESP